jgi:hypothetical protein
MAEPSIKRKAKLGEAHLRRRARQVTGERSNSMRGSYKFHHPFVWFEKGGWWFKIFGECFGPYRDLLDARYHLLVIQGLSQQLREAISG